MYIIKPSTQLIREGYKVVAMYYDKNGQQMKCLQKDNHCVIYRWFPKRRAWVDQFWNKDKANKFIKELTNGSFADGAFVRDKKTEKIMGIR